MKSKPCRPVVTVLRQICCAAAVGVGGCSLAPGAEKVEAAGNAILDTGISDRRAYNDKKAETLVVLPCDISIGAYYRLNNAVQQEAIAMLCSGRRPDEMVPPLTAVLTTP